MDASNPQFNELHHAKQAKAVKLSALALHLTRTIA
jgi:hypothetical protein